MRLDLLEFFVFLLLFCSYDYDLKILVICLHSGYTGDYFIGYVSTFNHIVFKF
jgi:hypothetical protein